MKKIRNSFTGIGELLKIRTDSDAENISSGKVFSLVVLFIQLCMFFSTFFISAWGTDTSWIFIHRVIYLIYALLSVDFYLICRHQEKTGTANHFRVSLIVNGYCFASVLIEIIVSLMDASKGESLLAFLTIVVSIFSVFTFTLSFSFVFLTISFGLLAVGLSLSGGISASDSVNLLIFYVLVLFISGFRLSRHIHDVNSHIDFLALNKKIAEKDDQLKRMIYYVYGAGIHKGHHSVNKLKNEDERIYENAVAKLDENEEISKDLLIDKKNKVNKLFFELESGDRDSLTGLFSINGFRASVEEVLLSSGISPDISIVYLNLLNFKIFNEKYGFNEGNKLLRKMSEILRENFPGHLICHLSEDHFAILAIDRNLDSKIENIHIEIKKIRRRSPITVKAGIYRIDEDRNNIKRAVDVAVAADKAKIACDSIKDRFDIMIKYYDDELEKEKNWQQYVISHIGDAIDNGEIEVFYQPIIRTMTGEICCMEALARWNNPEKGLLSPGSFMEILENAHMIHRLDFEILRLVCRDYKTHLSEGKPFPDVSINLSRFDFRLHDITDKLTDVLSKNDFPISKLHVEITESALSDDYQDLLVQINKLRRHGFEVWLDDFGSGYSSLNILQDCHFDVIKIDMMFLKNFNNNANSHLIISSIVDMAKELGIKTLIEGVETAEQLDFVRAIGCEKIQGYYYSKPVPDSFFGMNTKGERLILEDERNANYYNRIGEINILKPMWFGTNSEGYKLLGFTPIVVIEGKQGAYKPLLMNGAFENLLKKYETDGAKGFTGVINNLPLEVKEKYTKIIEKCRNKNDWEIAGLYMGSTMIPVSIHFIADNEFNGAFSFIVAVIEIKGSTLEILTRS